MSWRDDDDSDEAGTSSEVWERGDAPPPRPQIAGDSARLIMENVRERHFPVDSSYEGARLDRFLSERLSRLSRTKANAITRHGDLELVPWRKPRPGMRLHAGDVVVLREQLAPEWVQDAQVELLYEDEDLLVVSKPAGMLVHESASVRLNTIQWWLHRHGYEGAEPVHRLDRETSGVLVCARHAAMIPKLRDLFASDHPHKVYRALVLDPQRSWQPGMRRTITEPLGSVTGEVLTVRMGRGGLRATTHVLALGHIEHERFGSLGDLQVTIETGRQHQIRVHLEMQGTPIAGDKLYGQTDDFFMATCDRPDDPRLLAQLPFPRHALHAWRLEIPHPRNRKKTMEFEAPLPEELWRVELEA